MKLTSKICKICQTNKPLTEYYKCNKRKSGKYSICKVCHSKRILLISRTKQGLSNKIYGQQRQNSVERNHPKPDYSKSQLYDWLVSRDNFDSLYKNWKSSGYLRDLIPSADRLDDDLPYTLSNLQLVTWRENYMKELAKLGKGEKPVISICPKTNQQVEYGSGKKASITTKINRSNICSTCKGNRQSAGGLYWRYLILVGLLLITTTTFSQTAFGRFALDWSMLANGPGHSYEETSSVDYEASFGFEWDHDRVLGGIHDHEVINFRKWFLEYDKKLTAGRFDFYAGVELGGIWRSYEIELTNFNRTTDVLIHSFTVGVNFETQIRIFDGLHWSINLNAFTSENDDYSEIHEFLRWEVMSGLVFKIPLF